MALNPNPGVCEQISDQQRTAADQNAAHVAQVAANTSAGTQVHKHGAVAGPGSFIAHMVFHPLDQYVAKVVEPPKKPTVKKTTGVRTK